MSKLNPTLTFIYVSGAGTDTTERGRLMWARVKGETENALLRMPFKAVYLVTTTGCVGRAMLNVTKWGSPNPVLENRDINQMCGKES